MIEPIKIARNYVDFGMAEDIEKRMNKEKFFSHLQDENIDIKLMLKDRTNLQLRERFNLFLRQIKILYDIEIAEMLIFLTEEKEFRIVNMYKVLNYENRIVVKLEMVKRYRFGNKYKFLGGNDQDFIQ